MKKFILLVAFLLVTSPCFSFGGMFGSPPGLPNTVSQDGIVTKGDGQSNKVWKTDASGNPAWREDVTGASAGAMGFNYLEDGTNTTATMLVGTGASLGYTGTGVIDASRFLGVTSVSAAEFGYLDGVTSSIQSQLNAKAASTHDHDSSYIALISTPTVGNFATIATGGQLANSVYGPTDFQAANANLTTYAGIAPSANAQTLLGHTFEQMRSDLSLVAGTDIQAYNSILADIAGFTVAQGSIIVGDATPKLALLAKGTQGYPLVAGVSTVAYEQLTATGIANNTITATQLAATLTFADGDFIDLSGITMSAATDEGLALPVWANITPTSTSKHFIAFDASANTLKVNTSGGWITIGAGTGGTGAPVDSPYLLIGSNDATLTGERRLVISTGLSATDGGTDSTYTIVWAPTQLTAWTWGDGSTATIVQTFNVSTGTDPVLTAGNGILNVSTGTLQQGGVATALALGASPTANTLAYWTGANAQQLAASAATITAQGSIDIPTGQSYKINGTALAYGDVGAAPATSGTSLLKGDGTGGFSDAVAGTDYQGIDIELSAIAGLTSANDRLPYFTGSGTASLATFTSFARTLLDDADAATARTTLGAQAAAANLTTWAGVAPSTDGQALVAAANYAAMRTALGVRPGYEVQSWDTDLDVWATVTSSANGRSLVSAANYAAMKQLLDLEIGTDLQAYDADLGSLASGITGLVKGAGDGGGYSAAVAGTDYVVPTGSGASLSGITFSQLSGSTTNISASMTVGSGATLTYSGSGTINATQLLGSTWASPGAIGSTTPAAGAFTTVSATGRITTVASATGGAGFRVPHGTAPTSPVNGDVWTTTAGMYVRVNGTTVGPLGSSAGFGFDSIITGTNTAATMTVGSGGVITYTGSGSINATLLLGSTWASPGAIGGTTPSSGTFTFVAFGADPADSGPIRLSNATYIMSEAAPASTDISIIGVDASEVIQIGASGASGVTITPALTLTGALTANGNATFGDADTDTLTLRSLLIGGNSRAVWIAASAPTPTYATTPDDLYVGGVIETDTIYADEIVLSGDGASYIIFENNTSHDPTSGYQAYFEGGTFKVLEDGTEKTVLKTVDIDTYSELNTLVADQTLLHSGLIDTYAELNTIVADQTLLHSGLIDTISELNTIVADATIIVEGTATGGILLGDSSPDASGEIGYASNAFLWFANSEDLSLTATENLWTFSSTTAALFAFTPHLTLTGGASIAASGYLNFGTTAGESGYGIRDNSGTIEYKASGGSWAAIGSGGGSLTGSTGSDDNRLLRADGTGGSTVQASTVTIDDDGNISGLGTVGCGAITATGHIIPGAADTYDLGSAAAEIANIYLGDGAIIYGQNDQSATLTASASKWTANNFDVTTAFGIPATVTGAAASTWTLVDDNASGLSIGASGKADLIKVITTNDSEGVTMSGTLGVTGAVTATAGVIGNTLVDSTPDSNSSVSGELISVVTTTGYAASFGDLVVVVAYNSGPVVKKADADAAGTVGRLYLIAESISAGESGTALRSGIARYDTWDWATEGGALYVSASEGTMTQTAPSGSGDQVQIAGHALSADVIDFQPNSMILEIE